MGKNARIKRWRRNLSANKADASQPEWFEGKVVDRIPTRTVKREVLFRATGSRSIMTVVRAYARASKKDTVNYGAAIEWAVAQKAEKRDWVAVDEARWGVTQAETFKKQSQAAVASIEL